MILQNKIYLSLGVSHLSDITLIFNQVNYPRHRLSAPRWTSLGIFDGEGIARAQFSAKFNSAVQRSKDRCKELSLQWVLSQHCTAVQIIAMMDQSSVHCALCLQELRDKVLTQFHVDGWRATKLTVLSLRSYNILRLLTTLNKFHSFISNFTILSCRQSFTAFVGFRNWLQWTY